MLENEVAIITGGSEGIGFGIASALAEKGVHVYLVARTESKLEAAKDKIQARGGRVDIRPADIMDLGKMREIIDKVYSDNGRLDIFINNAGIWRAQSFDTPFEEIEYLVNFNMIAPLGLAYYLVDKFSSEKENNLKILTVSSQAALKVMPSGLGYGPAKMGLTSGLFHLDEEMRIKGVKNIQNYRLYPNTVATDKMMDAIRANQVQDPVSLEAVVDTAMDMILGKTPTRDVRIGYYPGKGIVRTYLSSDPKDFYNSSKEREVIVDPHFKPEDLF